MSTYTFFFDFEKNVHFRVFLGGMAIVGALTVPEKTRITLVLTLESPELVVLRFLKA